MIQKVIMQVSNMMLKKLLKNLGEGMLKHWMV